VSITEKSSAVSWERRGQLGKERGSRRLWSEGRGEGKDGDALFKCFKFAASIMGGDDERKGNVGRNDR